MKKILFALAFSLFMIPAFAQHHDNHHDNHHDIHRNDHHDHRDPHDDRRQPAPVIRIASPEEVDMISNYIRTLSFDKQKADGIKLFMQIIPMKAEDIARLVGTLSFDDDKKKVLKFCYPLCPDQDRYHIAIERLSSTFDRDEMYKFIATHR